MTTFWSTWICVLTIGSLIGLTWLLFGTRKGETKGSVDQTMGHAFDGIEEYDNPLPQWWFMLFAGTLLFAVGYLILYPGLATGKASCRAMKVAGPRPRNGTRKWPSRRQVRADLRQILGHAGGRSRQRPASAENGRAPVRLQLRGVPRLGCQGRVWLPEPGGQ